ncbi:LuxR C-terminal-related transcriptional regulator [Sphingomonas sp. 3-13AW]|uniref:LuxR C-terminal-related transcriptional regulator n=1 Tax=Sphingomonas sp. 3-13AW TaxID=3050450 RepID=UPI003BB4B7DC
MYRNYKISIIDSNEIGREGLKRSFSERGFGFVETRPDAACVAPGPNHLVLVTSADQDEALAICRFVRSGYPSAKIVIAVEDCCSDIVVEAIACGADGVLSKILPLEQMLASLHLIALGEKVIPTPAIDALPARLLVIRAPASEDSCLSTRELSVLERIAAGRANKLISRDLGIAEGTVKVHVKAILRKLGLANRTQAALWAAERAGASPGDASSPHGASPTAPRVASGIVSDLARSA